MCGCRKTQTPPPSFPQAPETPEQKQETAEAQRPQNG